MSNTQTNGGSQAHALRRNDHILLKGEKRVVDWIRKYDNGDVSIGHKDIGDSQAATNVNTVHGSTRIELLWRGAC